MIVVSDSSPLIALATVGHLHLLHELFGQLIVPDAVYHELVAKGKGRPGASEVEEAEWISRATVKDVQLAGLLKRELDAGEAEALVLAVERQADLVLLDERRARQRATDLGLNVVGVLGILVDAHQQNLLSDVRPVLEVLRE